MPSRYLHPAQRECRNNQHAPSVTLIPPILWEGSNCCLSGVGCGHTVCRQRLHDGEEEFSWARVSWKPQSCSHLKTGIVLLNWISTQLSFSAWKANTPITTSLILQMPDLCAKHWTLPLTHARWLILKCKTFYGTVTILFLQSIFKPQQMSFTQKLADRAHLRKMGACIPHHSLKALHQPSGFLGTSAATHGIFP